MKLDLRAVRKYPSTAEKNHAILVYVSRGKLRGTRHRGRESKVKDCVQEVCTVRFQVYSTVQCKQST